MSKKKEMSVRIIAAGCDHDITPLLTGGYHASSFWVGVFSEMSYIPFIVCSSVDNVIGSDRASS
jgi:hypothetical protein